jgi:hypothetical protein
MADDARPPAAADAGHIAEALRRSGVLGNAHVREVAIVSSRPTIVSRIIRLRLNYDGTQGDAPDTILLKTGLPERIGNGWQAGRQVVAFYHQVATEMRPPITPRCFGANYDATTHQWHLLLEDLTDTHMIATVWPLPPTTGQCERIVDAWARFHAAWWDDPRLGISIGTRRDEAGTDRILRDLAAHYARFADHLGDRLSAERRELYERFLAATPRLLGRPQRQSSVTLNHGDAHVWNVFLPRDGGDDLRLFDWDSWRIAAAAHDLAYMMALHWSAERRHRLERPLLDRYHAALLAHGVHGYDRAMLDEDYRRAMLWQMSTPIWQAAFDIPPRVWWPHLERILLAVDDLGCRDLLA